MKNLIRFFTLSLVLLLAMSVGLGVVSAQEGVEPGEGGIIVWGNQRGSANIGPLVPIRCSGVDCADMNNLLYPALLALDPSTINFAPYDPENPLSVGVNVGNSLATGWELSEDGSRLTVTIRDGMMWNDGTPITVEDVYFTWAAIQAGEEIGLSSSFGTARRDLANAEIIDDSTIAFDFETPTCDALASAAIPVIPSHAYGYDGSEDFDFSVLNGHPQDTEPTVTSGPFNFSRLDAGTGIYLAPNQQFAAPSNGVGVMPEGVAYVDVPDYNVMAERLIANQPGDINYIHEPSNEILNTLRDGGATVAGEPGRVWHYVALNTADPTNPQFGLDEDGNPIDQGVHPILGDARVRQALQHATDIEQIIASAQDGNATAMVSGTIPSAFSIHPELERRSFDLDAARELLDAAGWVSTGEALVDGGDGLRTCVGCETAEEGTEMFMTIYAPDQPRTNVAVILQAAFAEIGIDLEVQTLDFNTMYDDNLGAQTFDMAVAGWRGGLPFSPDQRDFFGAEADIPGLGSAEYGFNFGSWYNAEFEELSAQVVDPEATNGCDPAAQQEIAYRIQEIQWEEQPYLWLYAQTTAYAINDQIEGFDPYPLFGNWNMDAWTVQQ